MKPHRLCVLLLVPLLLVPETRMSQTRSSLGKGGTIGGTVSVSSNGGALYRLNIMVPPGTAGMQPGLAVTYNSQGHNGMLGLGFSLSGLSSINRCAPQPYLDGRRGKVEWKSSDKFCLDGRRLIRAGGKRAKYHMQHFGGNNIEPRGNCLQGPCSWKITRRDGVVLEYGTTRDSRLRIGIGPGRSFMRVGLLVNAAWLLKSVRDRNNNEMRYTYFQRDGRFYPRRIQYTYNAGLRNYRIIEFKYEKRPDNRIQYHGGVESRTALRLQSIRSRLGNKTVHIYSFKYESSAVTGRSLLRSISMCTTRACLPPTTFDWTPENYGFDRLKLTSRPHFLRGDQTILESGDFNGDGRTDFLRREMRRWANADKKDTAHIYIAKANGSFSKRLLTDYKIMRADKTRVIQGDYNGDGALDFIRQEFGSWDNDNKNTAYLYLNDGKGNFRRKNVMAGVPIAVRGPARKGRRKSSGPVNIANALKGDSVSIIPLDFDGDGITDFIRLVKKKPGRNRSQLYRGSLSGVFVPVINSEISGMYADGMHIIPGDFDGDGRTDFIRQERKKLDNDDKRTADIYLSLGGGSFRRLPLTDYKAMKGDYVNILPGDYNGDGLTDFIRQEKGKWDNDKKRNGELFLSRGDGTFRIFAMDVGPHLQGDLIRVIPGDFNGDGITDFIRQQKKRGRKSEIFYARGDGTFVRRPFARSKFIPGSRTRIIPGDFNGDGAGDFLRQEYGSWATADKKDTAHRYMSRARPLLIKRVINGLGGGYKLEYGPLPRGGSLYNRAQGAKYPVLDAQPAIYVVSKLTLSDGRKGDYSFQYRYSGARIDRSGPGWLGFAWMKKTEVASGVSTTTYYNQNYPLRGTLKYSETSRVEGGDMVVLMKTASVKYRVRWYGFRGNRAKAYALLAESHETSNFEGSASVTTRTKLTYNDANDIVLTKGTRDGKAGPEACVEYQKPGFPRLIRTGRSCAADRRGKCACRETYGISDFVYDNLRRMNLSRYRVRDGGGKSDVTITRKFDRYGNRISRRALGITTHFTHEAAYRTFQTSSHIKVNGIKLEQRELWDPALGVPVRETDMNGNVFENRYDGFGRITSRRGPGARNRPTVLRSYAYGGLARNASLNFIKTTNPYGGTSRMFVDGLGRAYSFKSTGEGREIRTRRQFDKRGLLRRESLPYFKRLLARPKWTSINYDAYGRPAGHVYPDKSKSRTIYRGRQGRGGFEREIKRTAAYGRRESMTTSRVLDGHGRLVRRVFADGATVSYAYDERDRLTRVRGPGGSLSFAYDSAGRVISRTSGDAGTIRYEYDRSGRLTRMRGAGGETSTYSYDPAGRPLKVELSGGMLINYRYDEAKYRNGRGRLTSAELLVKGRRQSSYEYSYDAYGRRSTVRMTLENGRAYLFRMAYDLEGRLRDLTYPDGAVRRYEYTKRGILKKVLLRASGGGDFTTYAEFSGHTAMGRPTRVSYANGVETRNTFTSYGELRRIQVGMGERRYIDHQYSWNRLHEITSIKDGLNKNLNRSFTYGKQGYLIKALGPFGTLNYQYDAAGNLKRKGRTILRYKGNRVVSASDGSRMYYDKSGNMIRRYTAKDRSWWTYRYDAGGRLREVKRKARRARAYVTVNTFAYDYQGRRIRKTDVEGRRKTITHYITPAYEVTQFPDGMILHTKYIDAGDRRIASVTKRRSGLSFWKYRQGELETGLYSLSSTAGLGAYLGAKVRGGLEYPYLGAMLWDMLFFICVLVLAVFLVSYFARFASRTGISRGPPTNFQKRHPVFAAVTPLVIICYIATLGLGTGALIAGKGLHHKKIQRNLLPGGNGAGYPVQGTYFFHGDHIGSVGLITDALGAVAARSHYLPYGAQDKLRSKGVDIFRTKFIGREWDRRSKLYYDNARYYDPGIGRFISADSYNAGGSPVSAAFVNPYAYTENNPVTYSDPSGHFVVALIAAAMIGAYLGGAAVNGSYNPGAWNWKSPKTYGGIIAGAAIGAAGAGVYEGAIALTGDAVAGGIIGGALAGAGEGAAFAALAGEDGDGIGRAAMRGALFGAAIGGLGEYAAGAGAGARSGGRMAVVEGAEETEGAAARRGCRFSFAGGTSVETAKGSRPIEQIRAGDELRGFDPVAGEIRSNRVVDTHERVAAEILIVKAGDREIRVTAEHPFWVMGKGWIRADRLQKGDVLYGSAGREPRVRSIERRKGAIRVYNFQVARDSNYFLGRGGPLAHNACGPKGTKKGPSRSQLRSAYAHQRRAGFRINTYRELSNMNRYNPGHGMNADHIISYAASRIRAEDTMPNITPAQLRLLRREAPAMNVTARLHRWFSRTFGGRNREHMHNDAFRMVAGATADLLAYRQNLTPWLRRNLARVRNALLTSVQNWEAVLNDVNRLQRLLNGQIRGRLQPDGSLDWTWLRRLLDQLNPRERRLLAALLRVFARLEPGRHA